MDIKMENIGFCYGTNRVLENINLEVKSGEVRALLGENGAGKSTLMNILGGVLPCTEGTITVDGKPARFTCAADSLHAGIGFVHQELNLIPDLTVYENMFITGLPKKGLFLDRAGMIQKTRELFESLRVDIDPCAYVRDLDVSLRQVTEICRGLLQNAGVIIMDEPTTSLTEEEVERVFGMIRTLREKGVAVIFISHKLNEVMRICDTYTVLRNGVRAAEGRIADTTAGELSGHLVGHDISDEVAARKASYGEEVLRLEHFSDGEHFEDITLSVRAGEILGVTGLLGDGRSDIFRAVFGEGSHHLKGEVYYLGQRFSARSASDAVKKGIAYIPADRKENGILKDMSVLDNGILVKMSSLKRFMLIRSAQLKKLFLRQKEELNIKADSISQSILSLSGGNQQKVILARWLMTNPRLLILDNPTQGVDVGAKAEIASIVRKAADNGTAVIWLSPEAREIVANCESACVLFHGKLAGFVSGEHMSEYEIMHYATGGK